VRRGFRSDPVPDDVLLRILDAAHHAPSVGFSQPWDFLVVRDVVIRTRVQRLVERERQRYAASLPAARARAFADVKVEAILDPSVNIVVTSDPTRDGRYVLGRQTQPRMAAFSTACAVQNLWRGDLSRPGAGHRHRGREAAGRPGDRTAGLGTRGRDGRGGRRGRRRAG